MQHDIATKESGLAGSSAADADGIIPTDKKNPLHAGDFAGGPRLYSVQVVRDPVLNCSDYLDFVLSAFAEPHQHFLH